jgi:hypothetical protein
MGFATVLVSTEQGLSEPAINLENESQAGIKADKVKLEDLPLHARPRRLEHY